MALRRRRQHNRRRLTCRSDDVDPLREWRRPRSWPGPQPTWEQSPRSGAPRPTRTRTSSRTRPRLPPLQRMNPPHRKPPHPKPPRARRSNRSSSLPPSRNRASLPRRSSPPRRQRSWGSDRLFWSRRLASMCCWPGSSVPGAEPQTGATYLRALVHKRPLGASCLLGGQQGACAPVQIAEVVTVSIDIKPLAYNSLWQLRNDTWSSLEESTTQLALADAQQRSVEQLAETVTGPAGRPRVDRAILGVSRRADLPRGAAALRRRSSTTGSPPW